MVLELVMEINTLLLKYLLVTGDKKVFSQAPLMLCLKKRKANWLVSGVSALVWETELRKWGEESSFPREREKRKQMIGVIVSSDKDLMVFALNMVCYKRNLDYLVFLPHVNHDKNSQQIPVEGPHSNNQLILFRSAKVIEHKIQSDYREAKDTQ